MKQLSRLPRRNFCQLLVAGATSSLLFGCDSSGAGKASLGQLLSSDVNTNTGLFVSALKDTSIADDPYFIGVFNQAGEIISRAQLPGRGHQVIDVPNKANKVLAFARRPGNWLVEIDALTGEISQQFTTETHHHSFGHGCFSADGRYLFTTEHAYTEQLPAKPVHGKIVVRDSRNYQVIAEYDSGGVGPHQCELMPDGKTLVIANGGIYTHPKQPRKKLNLATMAPNLSYMDIATGKIIASYQPNHFQSSIRHLAVASTGQVIMGIQQQNKQGLIEPLILSHQGENQLTPMQANEDIWRQFNHYTASVCINDEGTIAAISSPRGDITSYWQLSDLTLLAKHKYRDGAGVSYHQNEFVLTNGLGRIVGSQPGIAQKQARVKRDTWSQNLHIQWDNHVARIS
ncbi:DUF1513 domain-containing protein [Thalassotalea euphylliae]|uniref:DUF1513 domain-containing protein n=1 Tax=Thalassotalea euphylliae TaxID=1655234 RepID=A0A3E0TSZ9_9GAMM|nr:DUF1513 domain-containing protein [Thalassotalea euphylliae]REL27801.1 DUF1513 domain-containing protein [Thalassotalea euphylliae]